MWTEDDTVCGQMHKCIARVESDHFAFVNVAGGKESNASN
jgi:hypothetical protein